jgi:L,D-peptidoglycan transpeptidase YkuD (ErfK/YbiS/YcfS/YnhG family)
VVLGLLALAVMAVAVSGLATGVGPASAVTAGPTGTVPDARSIPLPWPLRLHEIGDARQVVVVTAADWRTSHARLQAWRLDAQGVWHQRLAALPARLGWNGFVPGTRRVQSSGETPAGTYGLLRGFGLQDPGEVRLPYRVVRPGMWWPYDPKDARTYNVMQWRRPTDARWRTSWAEHLVGYRTQYRYSVVLDFNLPGPIVRTATGQRITEQPADTTMGGGIFLHVNGRGPTAGCVSTTAPVMRRLLRWLDPAAHPVIAMGPREWLTAH